MVASPSALATSAGLDVLRRGGNAVDAAIATNAVLSVVFPAMCGLGGDAFWIVTESDGRSIAYNASGRAPRGVSAAALRESGLTQMPVRDARCVTVPGAVRSWEDVSRKHGTRSLDDLLAPAERYARDGFAVGEVNAGYFEINEPVLALDAEAARLFLSRGTPAVGSNVRNPDLAETIAAIRKGGADAFYGGRIGEALVATLARGGSTMTLDDLTAHRTEIAEPLRMRWHDLELLAHPPNSHGATTLMALGALGDERVAEDLWQHRAIEAIKGAFRRRNATFGDPAFTETRVDEYLSPAGLHALRDEIDDAHAYVDRTPVATGDTIYLCAVDEDGRCVSLIQSLYMNFGSGIIAEGTGVFLHNRGAYFNLIEGHANEIAGGKRPMHTLAPGMVLRDGIPALVYGTMGADGQPQNQVQILHNFYERGMSIQQAIDAPRWLYGRATIDETTDALRIESRAEPHLLEALASRGHDVRVVGPYEHDMGHAHGIAIDQEHGTLAGGCDPRADSAALGL